MNLIFIAALVAVCGAAKLDRTYLPPASAKSAGGSPGSLQTPFAGNSVNDGLPKGSFTNDFQGVVVDAAAAGTRASGEGETGLGAPRITYGSTDSRVGEAAFRGTASFRPFSSGQNFDAQGQNFEQESQNFDGQSDQGFNRQNGQSFDRQAQVAEAEDNQTPNAGDQSLGQDVNQFTQQANGQVPAQGIQAERGASRFESKPERAQSAFERTASILRYENEVGPESYHYAFETDNGISAEENGVATNGVQAQGGFSYTGDDGQVYSVTYTADEGGYRPSGDHLPTPPPIPEEILKALAKNAKDEAAGLVDDGSYDAERYNAGSDYAESDSANVEHNDRQTPKFENRPADVSASGSFINQNNRPSEANSNEQPNLENGSSDSQDVTNNNFGPAKGNTFLQSNRNKPSGAIGSSNNFGQAAQPESAPSSIGSGSRKEYLPPVNSFNHNGRPQTPSANAGQHNFGFNGATQTTAFASVGQAHNNFGSQPNSAIRRPDSEQAEVSAQGQSTGKLPESAFNNDINRFSQPVPSGQSSSQAFGSRNEYLPPKSHNDRRQGVRPQRPLDGASRFENSQPESFGNVQSNDGFSQSSSSSTFNTGLNAQPTQSSFKQQQRPQQFNQVPHQTTQMQQNQNRGSSDRREENKNEQVNAFSSINQVPTSQPSTELTTPFESEEKPQSIAGSSATFSGFAPQSNSRPGVQRLSQSNGQSFRQQPLALKPQAPAFGSQVPAQYSQSTYSNNQQIQQNRFSQNQPEDVQLSPSTERPSFGQPQVSDQSYYYRQPAKPFNTPSGSRLPGAPSGQFNKINQKSPQSNGQLSGLPQQNIPVNPFESQKEFNRGSTRYPIAPTLGPVAPTGASDGQFLASTASSQYNGITQASISPFQPQSQGSTKYPRPPTLPVASPTLASQFNGITQATASSFAASPSRPAFQQTSFNQPQHSSLPGKPIAQQSESQDKEVPIQQYNGEIYEYNKPPQGLPSPAQKEQSAVPQRGQSFDSERQPSRTQFASNQPLSQDMSAQPPLSSFGANSQMVSQPSRNQYAPIPSFESQRTSGQGLKPQSRPFTQPQGTRPSFGNQGSPNKCCESLDSKLESLRGASQADGAAPAQGQFTLPVNSQNSNRVSAQAQFGNQFSAPVSQPVSQGFAGRGESFGGPRKPPSFDQETGYHY